MSFTILKNIKDCPECAKLKSELEQAQAGLKYAELWESYQEQFRGIVKKNNNLIVENARLKEAIAEVLKELPDECTCDVAYADRKLTDPDCHYCEYKWAIKALGNALKQAWNLHNNITNVIMQKIS